MIGIRVQAIAIPRLKQSRNARGRCTLSYHGRSWSCDRFYELRGRRNIVDPENWSSPANILI
jgi:hypothetical protein